MKINEKLSWYLYLYILGGEMKQNLWQLNFMENLKNWEEK